MMMPSVFGESLMDDLMDFEAERAYVNRALYGNDAKSVMTTDVKETDTSYELQVHLPGFQKEDVNAQLKDGYLVITAKTSSNHDQQNEEGRYIRRESYSGSCARSFYVGDEVTQEEIHAKFEDGVLKVTIPKKDVKTVEENKNYIPIEG